MKIDKNKMVKNNSKKVRRNPNRGSFSFLIPIEIPFDVLVNIRSTYPNGHFLEV